MPNQKVKLSNALPTGDRNGLLAAYDQLVDNERAHEPLVVVAIVDRRRLEHDDDAGDDVATVRIRRVEVLTDKKTRENATRIMLEQYETRSGVSTLPLDLKNDLAAAVDAGIGPDGDHAAEDDEHDPGPEPELA